jgi:hypothetical protein
MSKLVWMGVVAALGIVASTRSAFAGNRPRDFQVVPFERNDSRNLVRATWQKGIGCPNTSSNPLYNCRSDESDTHDGLNQGLLLGKSGDGVLDPGQAGATLVGLEGQVLPSDPIAFAANPILGYDIRKEIFFGGNDSNVVGSHCGQRSLRGKRGSPRFEIQVDGQWYFVACGEPGFLDTAAGDMTAVPPTSNGWIRLRWPAGLFHDDNGLPPPMGKQVTAVQIVFDAGPDVDEPPSDQFGLAVLDNIFAWYRVEGDGSANATHPSDEDEGGGEDRDHDSCEYRHSDSNPDRNKVGYNDPSKKMRMSSTNIRSATYQANCVNLVGDGLVNGKSGYTYTYQACDLSTGLTPGIGTFTISINGPGLTYSKSAALTSGYVYIHPHL